MERKLAPEDADTSLEMVSGALTTNACKKYRHIAMRDTCPLCGSEKESSFHALITCGHAQSLWTQILVLVGGNI